MLFNVMKLTSITKLLMIVNKYKLKPKVHIQKITSFSRRSQVENLQNVKAKHSKYSLKAKVALLQLPSKRLIQQIIASDPKFKLVCKVHIRSDIMPNLVSKKLVTNENASKLGDRISVKNTRPKASQVNNKKRLIEQVIANDPKFKLVCKVHIRSGIMPNLVTKKLVTNENASKLGDRINVKETRPKARQINNKNMLIRKPFKNSSPTNKENSTFDIDPKFNQKCFVQVNHCKKLEALILNNKVRQDNTGPVKDRHVVGTRVLKYTNSKNQENSANSDSSIITKRKRGRPRSAVQPVLENKRKEELLMPQNELGQKRVCFNEDESEENQFDKVLRKRKTKNYRESSLNASKELQNDANSSYNERVPIYLQHNKNLDMPTRKDPFEFVSFSPSKKRNRGRPIKEPQPPLKIGRRPSKVDSSDSDSDNYDESMHNILKKLRRKAMKATKSKNVVRHLVKSGKATLKQKKVVTPERGIKPNLKIAAKQIRRDNERSINLHTSEILSVRRRISDRFDKKNDVKAPADDLDTFFGFDDDEEDDQMSNVAPVAPIRGITHNIIIPTTKKSALKTFISLTSTPLPNQRAKPLENQGSDLKKIHVLSNIVISPPTRREIEILATDQSPVRFDSIWSNEETPVRTSTVGTQTPNKSKAFISEISNINGEKSLIKVPSRVNNNLDQTVVDNPGRQRSLSTPWRSDNLTVHSYWLTVNRASLPSYNQDMVLEPKLVEKSGTSKTPLHTGESPKRKNMVQSSILSFINTDKRSPLKQVYNNTLFDYNKDDSQTTRGPHKAKRNILNDFKLSDNNSNEEPNVENYFGFDEESGAENVRIRRKRKIVAVKNKEARPMRVAFKELKKIRDKAAEELLDKNLKGKSVEEVINQSYTESHVNNTQNQEEAAPVGLFEELEIKPSRRSYERKRRRRRIASDHSDEDEEEKEEEKVKRKRKDVRTRAEEEQFKKWVADFNAMCDEVNQHSLEVD